MRVMEFWRRLFDILVVLFLVYMMFLEVVVYKDGKYELYKDLK